MKDKNEEKNEEDEFLIDDYDSEEDHSISKTSKKTKRLKSTIASINENLNTNIEIDSDDSDKEDEAPEGKEIPQIRKVQ